MHKLAKERWVVIDGCVWTEAVHEFKTSYGVTVKSRKAIAFNVGNDLANYIVKLHHEQLDWSNMRWGG